MEPEKSNPEATTPDTEQAPADALSRTPEELEQDQAAAVAAGEASAKPDESGEKKVSPIKKIFRKVNLYILIFVLLAAIAGAYTIVSYLNSQKEAPTASIEGQTLTTDALKQLANTDATVGGTSHTLNIQGSVVINGQTLARGNLNVAGNIQSGGSLTAPTVTISGAANLGQAQINSLQVATNTAVQGSTTLRDLNVSGASSFSGPLTASQITTSRLVLSGNAVLEVPNHLRFTGPSPTRSVNSSVLGSGGSVSVNGSDTSGTININTGNNPTAGCFSQLTFSQRFSAQPRVLVSPIGAAAGLTQYYVNRSETGFSICTNNAAPANQTFAFDYFVSG